MRKNIEVVPYNPNWPKIFEAESTTIKEALGNNCIDVLHVGSTSVPGLAAKPKIDIIGVVKDGVRSIDPLKEAGFAYSGEWNIPFKYGFTKRGDVSINLHVYEEDHSEIELNLLFRDHLRNNPKSLEEYAQLKADLLSDENSFKKQEGHLFSGYNLGKDAFIRKVLENADFNRLRFLRISHFKEWENYHRICKQQIFDPIGVTYDPSHPTITAPDHFHFILCKGTRVVTIAHIEFLNEHEAALRALATDELDKDQGFGKSMIDLLERWLKQQGKKSIKMHSRLSAEDFYLKLGYKEMFFDDPCIDKNYIDLGKEL